MKIATHYYSESRISNLLEHGLLHSDQVEAITTKKLELEIIARNFNAEIVKKHGFPKDFIIDPDMYAVLATADPQ